jgi:hypothetical protein
MSSYYNDPAIKLSEEQMEEMVGKPVYRDHDKSKLVGKVIKVTRNEDGTVNVEYESVEQNY